MFCRFRSKIGVQEIKSTVLKKETVCFKKKNPRIFVNFQKTGIGRYRYVKEHLSMHKCAKFKSMPLNTAGVGHFEC